MAPKTVKSNTLEPEAAENGEAALPDVPLGPAPAFAAKTPAYVNQLRESVIRQVNQYTRTLIFESEIRLVDTIRALVAELAPLATPIVAPPARPVEHPSQERRAPSTPQGKRPRPSDEERHDPPVKPANEKPPASIGNDAKMGSNEQPPSKKAKLTNGILSVAAPTTSDTGTTVSSAGQAKYKGKAAPIAGDKIQDTIATDTHQNAFDYPSIEGLEAGETALAPLRRYWTFHRALIPKKIGRVPFMHITDHRSILDKYVFSAIQCVTLSIDLYRTKVLNNYDTIGRWTEQAFSAWTSNRINPAVFPADERAIAVDFGPNTKEFMLPFIISDGFAKGEAHTDGKMHTLLLHCRRAAPGKGLTVFIMDSAPHWYEKNRIVWRLVIAEMIKKIGIDEDVACISERVYRQDKGSQACGLFVILNAWVAAMRLKFNLDFKVVDGFYEEAVQIVNLALSGHVDSAMLYYWLLHHKYIRSLPLYSADTVQKFTRSWTAADDETFERLRLDGLGPHIYNEILEATDKRPDGWDERLGHREDKHRLAPHERADDTEKMQAWEAIKEDGSVDHEQLWTKDDRAEFTRLYPNEVHRRLRVNEALGRQGVVLFRNLVNDEAKT
jgi:hypothetical protein